jgi:hypothetical protein
MYTAYAMLFPASKANKDTWIKLVHAEAMMQAAARSFSAIRRALHSIEIVGR